MIMYACNAFFDLSNRSKGLDGPVSEAANDAPIHAGESHDETGALPLQTSYSNFFGGSEMNLGFPMMNGMTV